MTPEELDAWANEMVTVAAEQFLGDNEFLPHIAAIVQRTPDGKVGLFKTYLFPTDGSSPQQFAVEARKTLRELRGVAAIFVCPANVTVDGLATQTSLTWVYQRKGRNVAWAIVDGEIAQQDEPGPDHMPEFQNMLGFDVVLN